MKRNLTEMVFILDRSGSMSGLERETIAGYNKFLKKQKKEKGDALITTVLFDDKYELLHYREDIKRVKPITEKDYYVRGCTALFDAVGKTVTSIEAEQRRAESDEKPEKTLFIITTDGLENSSTEYTGRMVQSIVSRVQEQLKWEFIFLGANIDAAAAAEDIGIRAERAVNYHADSVGTAINFEAVCCAASELRKCKGIGKKWRRDIDRDYNKRK